ncbi:MAG TPA: PSD1 and planctomycete cytochrome C domain-containing protein [Terriglobia bacterium]|nr:PSD1 and planctomycete cytochrome C domain-containing protein [Terriglobia bacterium]
MRKFLLFPRSSPTRATTVTYWFCICLIAIALGAVAWPPAQHALGEPGVDPAQPHKAAAASAARSVTFDHDIAPIFKSHCAACHSGANAQAKLRLDSEASILKGGVSGRTIIPGDSKDSLLVKRVLGLTDGPRMPMGASPLAAKDVSLIRAWIDHGNFSAAAVKASSSQPVVSPVASHESSAQSPLFATKIRPILASRCYQCHGPKVHRNGLRLDSLAAILKGSDYGKIVTPGNSADSRIIQRLTAAERPQMPYGGPPLSKEQIQLIRKWIDAGAPGPDSTTPAPPSSPIKHWAYMKPVRPPLPTVKDAAWCRNPIDYFVLAKLEKENLKPSPEADKQTLIRRVYLDLIGLPPTPQEVDAFVADKSPNAYEKVVDHLLASPHYGERWAREWLDLARYADTNGYEKDQRRTAWEYRDWVIKALNQNMSFRDFTIEQIAGDMLPNPTNSDLIATGFNRNTLLNQEGGVDPQEYYWYSLVDRVNTTAAVWMGTTLGCAQCHNHKFDPFTQKDFYSFLAFFDNSQYTIGGPENGKYAVEPDLELPTPEQAVKSKEFRAQIAKLQDVLNNSTPALEAAQTKWEARMKNAHSEWPVLKPDHFSSAKGATLKLMPDQSILAGGKNPDADSYTIQARTHLTGITGVRIEVLNDASLPNGGPGRDPDGNFFLSNFEVTASPAGKTGAAQKVTFKSAAANDQQSGYSAANLVSKEPGLKGWAIDSTPSKVPLPRQAVLTPAKPFGFPGGTLITVTLKHQMRHASRNIGRFRLSVTSIADPEAITKLSARMWPVLETPADKRTQKEKEELAAAFRSITPLLQPTRDQIAKLQKSLKNLDIVTAMILREKPGTGRPWTYIRERGSFLSLGDKVYANVPFILNPLPANQTPSRLALARWLVDDNNPLTARVVVNRYWGSMFGRGIVGTPEDFGTQGDPPTHPKLLDWLATEFMRDGWDMKAIKRLIVTSATYRQSSRVTPELLERDPYNMLLARGPRFRVEAEMVHDIALSASGLLSQKIGGPSVFPYQPDGIWDVPYSSDKWIISKGEDAHRRAIYTFMRRSAPYPSLVVFDAPSREFCTVRRVRTNTPLQALTTLNDPFFFDAARAMARRMAHEAGPGVAARIRYGFRLCTSRSPSQAELDRIVSFYNQELTHYEKNNAAACEVIKADPHTATNAPEQAAWTMVSNILLNLDETISKE